MRERTLRAVGTSAAFLAGSFLVSDLPDILTAVTPAIVGGFVGSVLPEWDNRLASRDATLLGLGNILYGGSPILKDVRKKYLTEEERKLSENSVGGLHFDPHSLLALALATAPFFIAWMVLGIFYKADEAPRFIVFGLMTGFVAAYAMNLLLTMISYGTFSRNGVKFLWPLPIKIGIPVIHSEEAIPDLKEKPEDLTVKDKRERPEKIFSVIVSLALAAAAVAVLLAKTDLASYIANAFS